ncbi:hypothetical protein BJV74DRAFT_856673, partial [Russula compacta]
MAGNCDCKLQCISCNKVGHHTRDPTCPAQEGYRTRRTHLNTKTRNKGKGKAVEVPNPHPIAD